MRISSFILILLLGLQGLAFDASLEADLAQAYRSILESDGDKAKLKASDTFKAKLRSALYKQGAWDHPFDSLNMCKLKSPDDRFRIFNWNVPLDKGQEYYEAIIMIPHKKKDMVRLIELKDDSEDIVRPEYKVLKTDKWFGALYFDIIPFKKGGKASYLLLGWDGDTRITNRKVVEVLTFNGNSVRLGAPVFKTESGLKRRLLFTYSEQVSMTFTYQARDKRLVFDHLAPRQQDLEGQYQFYGPDMSFDALVNKKGKWTWRSNVEFKRKRNRKDRDFKDPRIR